MAMALSRFAYDKIAFRNTIDAAYRDNYYNYLRPEAT